MRDGRVDSEADLTRNDKISVRGLLDAKEEMEH